MGRSYIAAVACLIGLTIIASGGAIYLIFQEPKESDGLVLNHHDLGPGWYTYYQIVRYEDYYPEFQWYLETELRSNDSDRLSDRYGWLWYGEFIHIEVGLADSSDSSKKAMEWHIPDIGPVMSSEIGDGGWYLFDGQREGGFYCGFTVDCYSVYIFLGFGAISEIPSLVVCLHIAQMQSEKLT